MVSTMYNALGRLLTNLVVTAHKLSESWLGPHCFRCHGGTVLDYQARVRIVC